MLCAISGSKNRKWKPVYKTVFFPNTHYANSFLSSADIGLKLFIDLIYSSNQYKYQKGKGKNWSCFGIIVILLRYFEYATSETFSNSCRNLQENLEIIVSIQYTFMPQYYSSWSLPCLSILINNNCFAVWWHHPTTEWGTLPSGFYSYKI